MGIEAETDGGVVPHRREQSWRCKKLEGAGTGSNTPARSSNISNVSRGACWCRGYRVLGVVLLWLVVPTEVDSDGATTLAGAAMAATDFFLRHIASRVLVRLARPRKRGRGRVPVTYLRGFSERHPSYGPTSAGVYISFAVWIPITLVRGFFIAIVVDCHQWWYAILDPGIVADASHR